MDNNTSSYYCECHDFGYYIINNKVICTRCNKCKPPGYEPNPHLYKPLPSTSKPVAIENMVRDKYNWAVPAKELRIGNYVLDHGCECYIHGNDIKLTQGRILFSQPIPITPSILERCGFKKSNEFDIWSLGQFDVSKDVVWWWCVDDRGDNEGTILREVKYLHQLQNIHFWVIGKELEFDILEFNFL